MVQKSYQIPPGKDGNRPCHFLKRQSSKVEGKGRSRLLLFSEAAVNRTGCLAKGTAYGRQIGQELLLLIQKAYAEGKISEADWQKLPTTPLGIVNLVFSQQTEKGIIEALLETYG